MASDQQKIEAHSICREFLELNKKFGLYNGSLSLFFNHQQRRQLVRHGVPSSKTGGGKGNLLSIKDAREKL